MLSPHPSYPPLEMATYGSTVVTNCYGPKDLSLYGPAFEAIDSPATAEIANALRAATGRWEDPAGPNAGSLPARS